MSDLYYPDAISFARSRNSHKGPEADRRRALAHDMLRRETAAREVVPADAPAKKSSWIERLAQWVIR